MKFTPIFFLSVLFLLGISSCVDNVIDEPPVKDSVTIDTNATVADIKAKLVLGQFTQITEDLVFDAIVVADDESGNFYKELIVQDETGGIAVRLEANNFYTTLPVGRKVFIRANKLFVSDYNGLPQIGYVVGPNANTGNDELKTIPFTLVGEDDASVIVPGARDQEITPTTLSINTLGNAALNTLVKIEGLQFTNGELGQTYANAADPQTTQNRSIEDCDGNQLTLRCSDFASWAGEAIPEGKGSIIGIYSIFGDTKQMRFRNIEDVELSAPRCDDAGNPNAPDPNATIADVKALLNLGTPTQITEDLIFDATVISSDQTGNFFKQLIVQDETGGMNIRIDDVDLFNNFDLGRKVVVSTKDLYIGDFNGLPQLGVLFEDGIGRISMSDYPNHVFKSDNGSQVTPAVISIDAVDDSMLNTLVTINNVEFANSELGTTYAEPGGGFAVNKTIQDCDENTIIMRNSDFADFAGFNVPEDNGSLTGILGVFGTDYQIFIRKIQDVNMTGTRCDGGGGGGNEGIVIFEEDFQSLEPNIITEPSGWSNQNVTGTEFWESREFMGNKYLIASAYEATTDAQECWLVTPEIEMTGTNILTFKSATSFHVHDGLTFYISSDFTGTAEDATWTELTANLASSGSDNWAFVDSGNVDLSSFTGKVHIGFKYEGSSTANTSNFLLDDIVITK